MAKFLFTAKGEDGQPRTGEMVADNERMVANRLREEGFILTSIEVLSEKEKGKLNISFFDRMMTIPLKEKMFFTRNLSVMISSGLSIGSSVSNLAKQTKNKRFQGILNQCYEDIQKGVMFSDALAKYPNVFSDLFVNMIRVGEIGGTMENSLKILTVQIEKEHNLKSKIRGAMIYPSVIIFAMIGVGVVMLTFILPKIMGVFEGMNVELPPMTKFVVKLSDMLKEHGLVVFIIFVILAIATKQFLKTEAGKRTFSWITLHLPAIKNFAIKINTARFCRIYSSLLSSGVSVVDSLDIVADTLSNEYYKDAIHKGRKDIQKGVTLASVVSSYPNLFPLIVAQMVKVGEETGKTEEMLLKMAEFYEEEINELTKNLSSIIEPVLMILIGGAVGFFAVAMMQPIYGLLENIN